MDSTHIESLDYNSKSLGIHYSMLACDSNERIPLIIAFTSFSPDYFLIAISEKDEIINVNNGLFFKNKDGLEVVQFFMHDIFIEIVFYNSNFLNGVSDIGPISGIKHSFIYKIKTDKEKFKKQNQNERENIAVSKKEEQDIVDIFFNGIQVKLFKNPIQSAEEKFKLIHKIFKKFMGEWFFTEYSKKQNYKAICQSSILLELSFDDNGIYLQGKYYNFKNFENLTSNYQFGGKKSYPIIGQLYEDYCIFSVEFQYWRILFVFNQFHQ